jgi:hypothetical protein
MNTRLVATAADVIARAMHQGRTLPAALAVALESAQLLQSPETADELKRLRQYAAGRESREEELLAVLGKYTLAESPEAWDLGMTVIAHLEGPHRPAAPEELVPGLRALVEQLRSRIAGLEADREANDAEYEQLAARAARLETAAIEGRAALASFCADSQDPGTAALGALYLLQQATPNVPMQPGETVPRVYRAEHHSIPMGLYLTATEARAHCVAEERRTWARGENPVVDWIEDEEDGVSELVTVNEDGETETDTGYAVFALEIALKHDEEAEQ